MAVICRVRTISKDMQQPTVCDQTLLIPARPRGRGGGVAWDYEMTCQQENDAFRPGNLRSLRIQQELTHNSNLQVWEKFREAAPMESPKERWRGWIQNVAHHVSKPLSCLEKMPTQRQS